MMKSSFSAVLAISLGVSVLVGTRSSADERCKQLDALRVKYAGIQLTPDQNVLKVKLTAWYLANCGKHEVADVKSATLSNTIR
jgi:hypothetical protein